MTTDPMPAIVARLRAAVAENGVSELAAKVGVKRAALGHYLDGRRRMPIEVAARVARELGYVLMVELRMGKGR